MSLLSVASEPEKASAAPAPLVFTRETALAKVKKAQDLWNTMDPKKVALAYTPDSIWRNRDQFFQGREAIEAFLTHKWAKEKEYRLRKELFSFSGPRIAVQFFYEFQNAEGGWRRTYGLEHWTFADDGLMKKRHMSGNEISITDDERWFKPGVNVDDVHIADRDG